MVEETPASTDITVYAIYSTDDVNWGSNDDLDDDVWEECSLMNLTEDVYQASGALYTFRYFKIKIVLETSVTTDRVILHTLVYLGNIINVFGMHVNETIAIGGTAISLSGFNSTPAITVTPISATPLIPVITAQSKDSVMIKVFNTAGNDVGGNVNITIIGA
jgi:hypothetical protein